jgi:phosphoribosyl 1,2-cyclic phosphodiesterase
MRVRFRGVRGSVPWVVPDAIAHGCNTACIEIVDDRTGATLVLDAGSGIVGVRPAAGAQSVSLLLTHYHWDHVLGLPFFGAFYETRVPLAFHVPELPAYDPSWLDTLFGAPFYPLPYGELPNRRRPLMAAPGRVAIDGFDVTAIALNHPGGALAYRVKGTDGDFVYATDHEFGDVRYDEPLGRFIAGAAAVVLDAQFTPEERPARAGWGHSDWRQCAEFAAAHGVSSLYLFHHKPGRTDRELEAIEAAARRVFAATEAAREGTVLAI